MCKEDIQPLYALFTVHTIDEDGYHTIDCIKGEWGVSGYNLERVEREAKNYFWQYALEGTYND